jgi:hypothetical protein
MLPLQWLLKNLRNQEEQLRKNFPDMKFSSDDVYDLKKESGKYLKIPTPVGIDEVETIRVYKFRKLYARAYVKRENIVDRTFYHDFDLYILRSYPLGLSSVKNPLKRPLYEAPVRIRYLSNIFHPNIMPGPDYVDDEYAGAVCWAAYSNWLMALTLDKLVESFKMLIENPNPDPREALKRPICLEAAEFFSKSVYQPVGAQEFITLANDRGVQKTSFARGEGIEVLITLPYNANVEVWLHNPPGTAGPSPTNFISATPVSANIQTVLGPKWLDERAPCGKYRLEIVILNSPPPLQPKKEYRYFDYAINEVNRKPRVVGVG